MKTSFHIAILGIVLTLAMKMFQYGKFSKFFFQIQAVLLVFLLLFVMAYVIDKLFYNKTFNKVTLYFLLIIAILPFYSAIIAYLEFGQPLFYGILAQRGLILFAVGIWFYYILVLEKMTLSTFESAFLIMAWVSLVGYSLFIWTYDPGQLQNPDEASTFVSNSATSRGLIFKFQTYFITFGAIYYFIKYSIDKKKKDFFAFLLFLGYILFLNQGRQYIMQLSATFLLYLWFHYSLNKLAIIFIKFTFFLLISIIIIQFIMPEFLENTVDHFAQMFTVLTGEESKDSSSNARIHESIFVFNYFDTHPHSILFGTGKISIQWKDGYEFIVKDFYPSDIGILGGLFVYGILGFIFIWLIPLIISIKTVKKITEKRDVFIMVMKYFTIYASILGSLLGRPYFSYVDYTLPLFILLAYIKLQENNHAT